jgi:hypothetical protein
MADKVWRRDETESPCVNICQIHPRARICVGCFRTADEIAAWSSLSPALRQEVMAALPGRAPLLKERTGRRRRGEA